LYFSEYFWLDFDSKPLDIVVKDHYSHHGLFGWRKGLVADHCTNNIEQSNA